MAIQALTFLQDFETERRRNALRRLIPLGGILTGLAVIGGLAAFALGQAQSGMQFTVGMCALFVGASFYAWYLLGHDRVTEATNIFVAGAVLLVLGVIIVICVATPFSVQSLTQLASADLVVVLAATVGGRRAILASVTLETLVILFILALVPISGPLAGAQHQRFILAVTLLLYHWAITGLLLVVGSTLERTLTRWHETSTVLEQTHQELQTARELDEAKDLFITNVNHELRTPIMAVGGYLQMLVQRPDLPEAQRLAMLQKAYSGATNLIALVNDVLDTRRVDSDLAYTPEPIAIAQAVETALTNIPEDMRAGRIIAPAVPPHLAIWGDPVWLGQVLTNLITNALKYSDPRQGYSDPHKPVTITATADAQMLTIAVRDWGLGVPRDQAQILFNRFVRLPRDINSPVHGTGTGLYLSKALVEKMGGAISLRSSGVHGEGSIFAFSMPRAADIEGALLPNEASLTPTRKRL